MQKIRIRKGLFHLKLQRKKRISRMTSNGCARIIRGYMYRDDAQQQRRIADIQKGEIYYDERITDYSKKYQEKSIH